MGIYDDIGVPEGRFDDALRRFGRADPKIAPHVEAHCKGLNVWLARRWEAAHKKLTSLVSSVDQVIAEETDEDAKECYEKAIAPARDSLAHWSHHEGETYSRPRHDNVMRLERTIGEWQDALATLDVDGYIAAARAAREAEAKRYAAWRAERDAMLTAAAERGHGWYVRTRAKY